MPTARRIRPLVAADRVAWEALWQAYLDFYGVELSQDVTNYTWRRLTGTGVTAAGLVAEVGGELVGVLHYALQPTTWAVEPSCYLEDLFVAAAQRGTGVGRALISHLAEVCAEQGWPRVHWITAADNAAAMRLYDQIATRTSWVRYEMAVERPADR